MIIINKTRKDNMKKNILVEFECQIGEYAHSSHYIFNKKNLNGDIAKNFGVSVKKMS